MRFLSAKSCQLEMETNYLLTSGALARLPNRWRAKMPANGWKLHRGSTDGSAERSSEGGGQRLGTHKQTDRQTNGRTDGEDTPEAPVTRTHQDTEL